MVKKIIDKSKEITNKDLARLIDGLASIMANGFKSIDNKFEKKINELDEKLSFKIDGIQNGLDSISLNKTSRAETKTIEVRVVRLEDKVFGRK